MQGGFFLLLGCIHALFRGVISSTTECEGLLMCQQRTFITVMHKT